MAPWPSRPPPPPLEIDDLHVVRRRTTRSCAASSLAVEPGELHALMGPNGSGKSTLANTLLGNPAYEVTGGRILLGGEDITDAADRRAGRPGPVPRLPAPRGDPRRLGLQLLAPGDGRAARASTTSRCSRCACSSSSGRSASAWTTASRSATSTRASRAARRSATRCSRWRCWSPTSRCSTRPTPASTSTRCARSPAGIDEVREDRPQLGILLITHYQRILDHLVPDVVHVLDRRPHRRDRRRRARARRSKARASTRSGSTSA